MGFLTNFFLIAAVFGPGLAISYGLGNPHFNPAENLTALLVLETLSVAFVYSLLRLMPTDIRLQNKLLKLLAGHIRGSKDSVMRTMETVSGQFKKRLGDLGFYMGLALISFAYGVFISAAVAYFLKVSLRRAMASIAVGAAVAIVFWWYLALGAIPFITPFMVFATTTALSAAFMAYGFFREQQVLDWIVWTVLDKKADIAEGIASNVTGVKNKLAKNGSVKE